MNIVGYKRAAILLGAVIILHSFGTFLLARKYVRQKNEAKALLLVIASYDQTRKSMAAFDDAHLAELLEVTVYARASFQDRDLSVIMEFERKHLIYDIINLLRTKTGKDFGDAPETWLKEMRANRSGKS